ncbi:hypothetical protein AB0H83_06835 [Dactylosporangium sp. NPDC050688]|uniref:hypothetical protein n=1 Tax=Dactylosporangium sp. NPDC050688 TaxID=3157217 RepID=UPI00340A7A23
MPRQPARTPGKWTPGKWTPGNRTEARRKDRPGDPPKSGSGLVWLAFGRFLGKGPMEVDAGERSG